MGDEARFEFGANWARFLGVLNEQRISIATQSLRDMLQVDSLAGKTFLDVGSGSGLFSLAARRLGARVHSFDYDPQSVACTAELRARYFPDDADWKVERGSALDREYLTSLGTFDVVYSWGVLHHTGNMWEAMANVDRAVPSGGTLFIALYNDQGTRSRFWWWVKRIFVALPRPLRVPWAVLVAMPFEIRNFLKSLVQGRFRQYLDTWKHYETGRGMSRWHDLIDWMGGFPYEVASAEAVQQFYRQRGYEMIVLRPTEDAGCGEYVLRKR